MSIPKVAIIYYSATGTNHQLANAVAEGASAAGADPRLRMVAETAPTHAIEKNPEWKQFTEKTKGGVRASLLDLEWADAVVFGTPTRYGNVCAQLKNFLDSTGELWFRGALKNKVYAGFTSAQNTHGGQESTLLALYNTIYHFGGIIACPGYTDASVAASGGNPYGPSATADGSPVPETVLSYARHLGKRVTELASRLEMRR